MNRDYELKKLKEYLEGKLHEEINKSCNKLYEVSFLEEDKRFNGFQLIGDINEDIYKQLNSTLLWDWNISPYNSEINVSNFKKVLDTITDNKGNVFIVTSTIYDNK